MPRDDAVAGSPGSAGERGADPASVPNVLIVLFDDVAERDVGTISTPAFDRLAAGGLRFRRAYAAPMCSPARRQLLFGYYQTAASGSPCAQRSEFTPPSPSELSLPRALQRAGYRTALFGKWHLGVTGDVPWERAAQQHGFDVWRAGVSANVNSECPGFPALGKYTSWVRVDDGESSISTQYQTHAVRDAFLGWHAEVGHEPWFALVAFQAPHQPYHSPPGRKVRTKRGKYEAMLEAGDEALGAILAGVDLERTLVIVTADNGTPPSATSSVQDPGKVKESTFEDGIRVPMAWHHRGLLGAPRETGALVSFVDFLPTIVELAGAEVTDEERAGWDGVSIVPLLESAEARPRDHVFVGIHRTTTDGLRDLCVVGERWKYRELHQETFLFDLEEDPRETHNRSGEPDLEVIEAELRARLRKHAP